MTMTIPEDALRQHVAIVGKTGSGKTYTAKGVVERLLSDGRRVCVLDPTGAWWGLRTAADERGPGFPVMIFGGEHGDVPISEHAGEAVGRLVAEQNVPCVIDLSETMLSERQRFVERFAEAVYRLNKAPLHLVIDEADEFAPQNPLPETKRMLGAIDRIVRRGRIRGFRVMMISQRPAVIHKNVLTQANTLVAMRLTSPQDRKAVEEWVKGQADAGEGRAVLASLAKLTTGEGWVWAPEHDVLERARFPQLTTYDSSRTPDDDDGLTAPLAIAEVDVSGVRQALEQAIAEAEANDPARLQKRIKALEAEIRGMQQAPVAVPLDTDAIVARAKNETAAAYRPLIEAMHTRSRELLSGAETLAAELQAALTLLSGAQRVEPDLRHYGKMTTITREEMLAAPHPFEGMPVPKPKNGVTKCVGNVAPSAIPPSEGLSGPDQKILHALAWWHQVGVDEPTAAQVGFVAGYAPKGGTFSRYLSSLSSAGLIDRRSGRVALTADGCVHTRDREPEPATLADLHERMRHVIRQSNGMGDPHVRILDAVIACGRGAEISTAALAGRAGYAAEGGTFSRYLSSLSSVGLIVRRRGMVSASALCFPEALR